MGIRFAQIEKEDFSATAYYLTCNVTGRDLVELLVKKEDDRIVNKIEATSPFAPDATSGVHEITGDLVYGGIEGDYPTYIKDIVEQDEDNHFKILVDKK